MAEHDIDDSHHVSKRACIHHTNPFLVQIHDLKLQVWRYRCWLNWPLKVLVNVHMEQKSSLNGAELTHVTLVPLDLLTISQLRLHVTLEDRLQGP